MMKQEGEMSPDEDLTGIRIKYKRKGPKYSQEIEESAIHELHNYFR